MPYSLKLSKKAELALDSIAEYIAKDNPYRAITFPVEIVEHIEATVCYFPKSGRKYKDFIS